MKQEEQHSADLQLTFIAHHTQNINILEREVTQGEESGQGDYKPFHIKFH